MKKTYGLKHHLLHSYHYTIQLEEQNRVLDFIAPLPTLYKQIIEGEFKNER
jgi:hypothetical protein